MAKSISLQNILRADLAAFALGETCHLSVDACSGIIANVWKQRTACRFLKSLT